MARKSKDPDLPKGEIGQLRFLLPYLRPYRGAVAAALAALVVAALAVLAIGPPLRQMIDQGFSLGGESIDRYFLMFFGVIAVLAAGTFGRYFLVTWLGERVVADVRKKLFNHIMGLSPVFFEENSSGEIASRLTTDTTVIQGVVGSSASVALRNVILLFGGTVAMFITSPKLALLSFVGIPVIVLPIIVLGRKVRRLSRLSQDRIADVSAHASEAINAVQTVQAFTHEKQDREIFGQRAETAFDIAIKRTWWRAWLTALVILMIFGAVDIVLWIGAKDVVASGMSGGDLAQFIFYAIVAAGAVGALSEVYGELQRAAGACGRIMDLLATEPEITSPSDPVALPDPSPGTVAMESVTFSYPSRPDDPALRDFSLSVETGETVALVGPSGAGKSTVFQLLLRFYEPQSGRILVDGVDIARISLADLRQRLGIVPQETTIFSETAFENIRYGRPDAGEDEIRAAARAALAEEFIEILPNGYQTHLGERGVRLSGGQRQRIAIARAILRNPPILLLDEATSALDAESEQLVQEALSHLMAERTTLVIAHRLATVQKADRIVVMDEGRIIAHGNHESLVAEGGLYARLAELQFDANAA